MKIAIIGGGICGLYLSLKLALKNSVFLFERKNQIGGKPCSALYSSRIFQFLPEAKKYLRHQINYCLIHFPRKTIKLEFKRPFFVFERKELEKFIFERAKEKGVKFFFSREISEKDLKIFEKEFERIIGCDGANSVVRKYLKIKKPKYFLGIQGFLFEKDNSDFVETWVTRNGFLWKIPAKDYVEYGILEKGVLAKKIFLKFCQERKLEFSKLSSALIPQGFSLSYHPKITLCGDAVGLTKPWSGGGVIWGLSAAEILAKNFPDFLKYQKELKKTFIPQIIFSQLAKKLVYFLGFNFPPLLFKNYKIDGDFLLPYSLGEVSFKP